jgi:hypothetical protein
MNFEELSACQLASLTTCASIVGWVKLREECVWTLWVSESPIGTPRPFHRY